MSAGETIGDAKGNGAADIASVQAQLPAASFEHDLLHALQAMRVGDFSVRMVGDEDGVLGKIAGGVTTTART